MTTFRNKWVKGDEDKIRLLVQTGIMSIREKLDQFDKIAPIDLMLIGHNLHLFMIDVAFSNMDKDISDRDKEKQQHKIWTSVIDTLLENSIGIDSYVNHVISERTDEYIDEVMGNDQ